MHAVDRGPEPSDLKAIRTRYTPRWVAYYPSKKGKKPTDSKWRDFHGQLREAFNGICGYCEDECKGEVDHFRPKKTFPKQVYWWTNWVFACHVCNNKKGEKWTVGGYVDPCAKSESAQPESYFEFDTKTGELLPKRTLTPGRHRKAANMIKHFGLNAYHQCHKRMLHLRLVSKALDYLSHDDYAVAEIGDIVTSRDYRFSSLTRAWLRELA